MLRYLVTTVFTIWSICLYAQDIIPKPVHFKKEKLLCNIKALQFIYTDTTHSAMLKNAAHLQEYLKTECGLSLSIKHYDSLIWHKQLSGIALIHSGNIKDTNEYTLTVGTNLIRLEGSPRSIFYGIQTLRQLFFHHTNYCIITCVIRDAPRFSWRGMHLDVSRHFFHKDFIKKYIDILALHKMNVFHWHLTDDQGWRIEIKKYPKLSTIASQREETMVAKHFDPYIGDGKPHGGYYSQKDIREIVDYAAERYITVVPEIEMPGHAVAALSAYPEYSCKGLPLKTLTKWGVSEDVFCTKDSVFDFLFNILDEVLLLFPSKYIHIGGDEVPKTRWKTCHNCQSNIRKFKRKDEHELQSYFITKIDSFLTSKGRNTIGWDEILEGGLAPNAAVMSWRGEEGGIEAATQKHHVVMSPTSHCYFDYYQGNKNTEPLAIGGYTTVKKVYSYEPIPAKLPKEYHSYVLGAQANLWTEYIPTEEHAMYMMLPRVCAISEVLWTPASQKNYDDFNQRLIRHFKLLKKRNYNYARSIYDIHTRQKAEYNSLRVSLESEVPYSWIYYTLDGSIPTQNSHRYMKPIVISHTATLQAASFSEGKQQGATFKQEYVISKSTGAQIELKYEPSKSYNNGGKYTLIDGVIGSIPWSGKEWLGWNNHALDAQIILRKEMPVSYLKISFLQAEESWIHLPELLEVAVEDAAGLMQTVARKTYADLITEWKEKKWISIPIKVNTRKYHIMAKPLQKIPDGKPGAGEPAWLFCSEIIID